jgi:hypothetical protein
MKGGSRNKYEIDEMSESMLHARHSTMFVRHVGCLKRLDSMMVAARLHRPPSNSATVAPYYLFVPRPPP